MVLKEYSWCLEKRMMKFNKKLFHFKIIYLKILLDLWTIVSEFARFEYVFILIFFQKMNKATYLSEPQKKMKRRTFIILKNNTLIISKMYHWKSTTFEYQEKEPQMESHFLENSFCITIEPVPKKMITKTDSPGMSYLCDIFYFNM